MDKIYFPPFFFFPSCFCHPQDSNKQRRWDPCNEKDGWLTRVIVVRSKLREKNLHASLKGPHMPPPSRLTSTLPCPVKEQDKLLHLLLLLFIFSLVYDPAKCELCCFLYFLISFHKTLWSILTPMPKKFTVIS